MTLGLTELRTNPVYTTVCTLLNTVLIGRRNNDLFHRLETVYFFRPFTGEGDMENTGRGNTEHRGLKAIVLP